MILTKDIQVLVWNELAKFTVL